MATVADIVTRAERGKYMAYASMGVTLGPAFGPLIGGLLDHFLGWRAIFWFLTIFTSIMLTLMIFFFPETSRSVVGNGSVQPQKWNLPIIFMIRRHRLRDTSTPIEVQTLAKRKRRPNPLASLLVVFRKEESLILFSGGLLFSGFFAILSTLPSQLQAKYQYNSLQIGLCYIPYGAGSMTSRWTVSTLIDWNFRRHAKKLGIEIVKNRQQKITEFPMEVARLQITLPLIYMACVAILIYSWVMEYRTNIAGPVITLFLTGHTVTGAFSSLNTLIVDINPESPATAVAAGNLVRCLMGAGAVAAAVPVVEKIKFGWTGTVVAIVWAVSSPALWAVMRWGHKWRKEKAAKLKAKEDVEKREMEAKPVV
jgi:MFS family permease